MDINFPSYFSNSCSNSKSQAGRRTGTGSAHVCHVRASASPTFFFRGWVAQRQIQVQEVTSATSEVDCPFHGEIGGNEAMGWGFGLQPHKQAL